MIQTIKHVDLMNNCGCRSQYSDTSLVTTIWSTQNTIHSTGIKGEGGTDGVI